MKTFITAITVILLGAGIAAVFYSCNTNSYSVSETILVDKTDSFLAGPDSTAIKNSFSSGLWQGYEFRLLTLSDVDYNPVYETKLSPACEYFSNVYGRQDKENEFFRKIDSAFVKVSTIPAGRNYSSLYLPVATELKRLSESTAKRRILIVYSDMMENTSVISFYKPQTLELLKTKPDSIKKILEREATLPNLSGIEVYIIYQPRNEIYNTWFLASSGFYKQWLESKGAKVTVEANLTQE